MEIDNMKDNFISNISHELRTPLTSIKSYTQLINDGLIGPVTEDQKEGLATILKSTDRLIGLINNLLDIAKYQSGKMKLERSNCNINDIINNVIKEFLPQIKEVNGRIKFSPSKSIILNLDEEKIERVLGTL
jgi:signal transduction histidine kinase